VPRSTIGAGEQRAKADGVEQELRQWLGENWDPDLTVAEWWEHFGLAGWAGPSLPSDCYGRGLGPSESNELLRVITEFGALGPPGDGFGLGLAAPTIAMHGTREQIDVYVRDIVTGKKAWCQLFSEPGAGSDLAGLTTRAVKDGDVWMVNGQKVWTSAGHRADLGMLLARTDPGAPKHQGITWFCLDMRQPGVEVRPLRQMTGTSNFNEVFITDAVVSDAARIGDVNNGWAVANTTLRYERRGIGAGGGGRDVRLWAQRAYPGAAGDLERRAGDFVRNIPTEPWRRPSQPSPAPPQLSSSPAQQVIKLARRFDREKDPIVRQAIAHLHILREVSRLNGERQRATEAAGGIPGLASLSKLLAANIVRLNRDLGLQILGPRGTLHAYREDGQAVLDREVGGSEAAAMTAQALSAQSLSIAGGTDQIQKNIVGERVLGLPKDPGDLSTVPFNQLPHNG
jgi:alkylation response protein AidB-like acyl-CoA dehydrogenase